MQSLHIYFLSVGPGMKAIETQKLWESAIEFGSK
jgi:hypothetical protein